MRIAIDARKLRDFGIGTYIRNILMELSRLDRDTEYVVLCRPDDIDSGDVLGQNFRMVPETALTGGNPAACEAAALASDPRKRWEDACFSPGRSLRGRRGYRGGGCSPYRWRDCAGSGACVLPP